MKLPVRPEMPSGVTKFGINPVSGIWAEIDGQIRSIVKPDGVHLLPSDFSDLYLQSLLFTDELGHVHEVSLNASRELLIDDVPVVDLSNFYSKQEVDELIKQTSILISPDGAKWRPVIDDTGQVTYEKELGNA